MPPEEWENSFGTGYGDPQSQERTGEDSDGKAISVKETYYPCCGQNILPAAADHRHKSNIAPTDAVVGDGYSAGGNVGSSVYAARFDHKHPYPMANEVVADDGEETKTVQEALEDHNTRIEALEYAEAACDCATKWEEQYEYDAEQDDDITTAYETAEAAQTDATDAKTKVDAITVGDGASAKVPLTALTGNIDGHGGTCYVTINNDGSLGHSLNKAYNLLNAAQERGMASKLLTDADLSQDEIDALKEAAKDINGLKTTAEEAKTAATDAQTTATEAKTAADTAKTTAESATTTAEAAQTAATEAKTAADTANTAAGEAKTTATTAQTTANTANTTANTAKSKIDAVTVAVGEEVRVPLSKLTGNISGHKNTCYVTIDNDGNLGHSGNTAFNLLNTVAVDAPASGATKLLTDADLSSDDITTLTDLAEAVGDNPYTGEITVSRAVYEINSATNRYTWFFKNRTLTIKSGLITAVSDEAYAPTS